MAETITRWSRRYVFVSIVALLCWQVGILFEVPRRTEVVLGLLGFVFHMIFGKAYALVPSYFDSELAFHRAPKAQFPLVVFGTGGLGVETLGYGPGWLSSASVALWGAGIVVFVGALLSTIGRGLVEGETGTGKHNAARKPVDRVANLFVPVALLYLLAGTYGLGAFYGPLPALFGGLHAQVSHLLATGTATLLVFALGFRLLPRFLVVHPPTWTVYAVLPMGAVGPALIVAGITDSQLLTIGATLEAVALGLFALVVFWMFVRSDRRRTGFYGVLGGMACGVTGVGLGLVFAFHTLSLPLTTLHLRINVLGFLGLTIIGLAYHFYPPSVGNYPGCSDRTALFSVVGILLGLSVHILAVFGEFEELISVGYVISLIGSVAYAYLVVSAFRSR